MVFPVASIIVAFLGIEICGPISKILSPSNKIVAFSILTVEDE